MLYFNENERENECIVTCQCGHGEGIRVVIDKDDDDEFIYQLIMDVKWNTEQHGFFWKLRKIWAVIRNKDYYYSEICMTKDEFTKFRDWLNKF